MKIPYPKTSLEYLLFKLPHSVMVSTRDFDSLSLGSSPNEVTLFLKYLVLEGTNTVRINVVITRDKINKDSTDAI